MAVEQSKYDALLAARLKNFFHHRTPWQRALWSVGTIVGLEEVAEYSEIGPGGGSNSNEGLKYVAAAMSTQVATDEGLGSEEFRSLVGACLDGITTLGQKAWPKAAEVSTVREFARRGADDYVQRWGKVIADGAHPSIELVARRVAPHLLDAGLSAEHLNEWLRAKPDGQQRPSTNDLFAEAQAMVEGREVKFEVCVPLSSAPLNHLDRDQGWTDAPETVAWLAENGMPSTSERIAGSLIHRCEARDPWSAVREAHEIVTRSAARVAVAFRTNKELRPTSWAWVAGQADKFQLRQPRRQVEVPNLARALSDARSYGDSTGFDDAIELAASMEQGNPGAAITGAWAAIEGLLARVDEKGTVAADRMADLVTCSWARAELTSLAWLATRTESGLADRLKAQQGSARARELELMLRDGDSLEFDKAHDQAAVERMRAAVAAPPEVLRRVRGYTASAFRRLYTQRNLVMHAGTFHSRSLRTTLRTLPPLVGAGLDRIAWAAQCDPPLSAVDLAARAEVEIEMVGKPGGRWLTALLD